MKWKTVTILLSPCTGSESSCNTASVTVIREYHQINSILTFVHQIGVVDFNNVCDIPPDL